MADQHVSRQKVSAQERYSRHPCADRRVVVLFPRTQFVKRNDDRDISPESKRTLRAGGIKKIAADRAFTWRL
jgi:hypothetical protein